MTSDPMRIAVGAITRRRPDKLADLLDSFVRMEIPERTEIKFFIVENDESKASRDVVDGFRTSVAAPVRYDLETEPGIPFARNAVLDAALEEGMDYLTFVDDDETVRIDWLRKMITGMKAHGLDLGGGPSFAAMPREPLSGWRESSWRVIQDGLKKDIAYRAGLEAHGTLSDKLIIPTNNWCLRLDFARKHGLRFDPSLSQSGGSDARFSIDARKLGAVIGWIPAAVTEEDIPDRRLTVSYCVKTSRDRAANKVHIRNMRISTALRRILERFVEGSLCLLATPLRGRLYLIKALCKFADAGGTLIGLIAGPSRHYGGKNSDFHFDK